MPDKMPVNPINKHLNYDAVGERVYRGEVLLFTGGGQRLLRMARTLCRRVFATPDIEKAHEKYSGEQFLLRAAEAQEAFNQSAYKYCFADWLKHLGIAVDNDIYWDTLGLRIAPPVQHRSAGGGFRSHVNVHRDTWGSGIQAQINWWAPITPLAYKRTMAFYPHYWTQPLKNTTDCWSFADYMKARREAKASGKAASYPSVPRNTEQPHTPPHLIKPHCGQLLAFSSAHLHSSVLNRTGHTRFSLEIRTVRRQHILAGKGAPNVDCYSEPPLYQLFHSAVDNKRKIADALPVKTD